MLIHQSVNLTNPNSDSWVAKSEVKRTRWVLLADCSTIPKQRFVTVYGHVRDRVCTTPFLRLAPAADEERPLLGKAGKNGFACFRT